MESSEPSSFVCTHPCHQSATADREVVTCLDPRCVPEQYLGPDVRAGVIRNAGGRASPDVVKSVLVLRSLVDVDTVLVVHHTGELESVPFCW